MIWVGRSCNKCNTKCWIERLNVDASTSKRTYSCRKPINMQYLCHPVACTTHQSSYNRTNLHPQWSTAASLHRLKTSNLSTPEVDGVCLGSLNKRCQIVTGSWYRSVLMWCAFSFAIHPQRVQVLIRCSMNRVDIPVENCSHTDRPTPANLTTLVVSYFCRSTKR